MELIRRFAVGIFLLFALVSFTSAQKGDSIVFGKIKKNAKRYEFDYLDIDEIHFELAKSQNLFVPRKDSLHELTSDMLILSPNDSLDSLKETLWVFFNRLKLNGKGKSITLPLYVNGTEEKDRTLIYDEEGLYLEKSKTINLSWEDGSAGFLVSAGDTLGSYRVELRKTIDDPQGKWNIVEGNIGSLKRKLNKFGGYNHSDDFILSGTFEGKDFKLTASGRYFRYLAEIDNQKSLWQDKPHDVHLIVGKKHRIYPYVLVEGKTEQEKLRSLVLISLGRVVSLTLMNSGY